MNAAQKHQVLVEWNDTWIDFDTGSSVDRLFVEQAKARPETTAIVCGEVWVSYSELRRRARLLAERLRALGVEPGAHVGICLERSASMVVALLAVLEVGGAYVPIDPRYPRERLSFILDDSGVSVVVTRERLCAQLPEWEIRTLCLESMERNRETIGLASGGSDRDRENSLGVAAESVAYVTYTSGSTGRPKGVIVTHRSIVRLVCQPDYVRLGAEDVLLQLASISFDAATFEIWGALLNGARLAVPPPGVLSLRELGEVAKRFRVTTLFLTTGLFHPMVDHALTGLTELKQLLFGGDVLSVSHARRAAESLRRCRLIHCYGPTENTTFTSCYKLEAGALTETSVPIGKPVARTQVHILDRSLEPVPPESVGELYTGGCGVARGYLRRPSLTAERFVPNPFTHRPGERLYRTGDLVRYLADGRIDFVGRNDHQVKVRGFRIEQGEIEAALVDHPLVHEAVVVAPKGPDGERRLFACLVADPISTGKLHDFLLKQLPEYMVPSIFLCLDALPLTTNGKVDRAALARQAMEPSRLDPENSAVSEREGGSPDTTAPAEDPLSEDLEDELLELLLAEEGIDASEIAETIPRRGPDEELHLSFAQKRLWFWDQLKPGGHFYNVPGAVRLLGPLDVTALAAALNEIVRRHESLRTTFNITDGEPRQIIAESAVVDLPIVDLGELPLARREAELDRQTSEEARRPFDLERGPLLRARLMRVAAQEYGFCLTMHHIISDGWSIGVLLNELAVLYGASRAGEPLPLSPLPIQYADFALWQRRQYPTILPQLDYWRQRLGSAAPELPLLFDRPRPPVQTFRGADFDFELPRAAGEGLKALAQEEDATLFMAFMAVFQALLVHYSRQADISVATPVAGRTRPEVAGLIGFFVNTLVLRNDFSGDPSFRQLLRIVRRSTIEAQDHQDLPFEKVVEELQPERSLDRSPLMQVMFSLERLSAADLELPELRVEALRIDTETSLADLMLWIFEKDRGWGGRLDYNPELFDRTTVGRLAEHLHQLLMSCVADPEVPVGQLEILSTAQSHQVVVEWNDTGNELASEDSVYRIFATQAECRPKTIAVACGDAWVSYGELSRRVGDLAQRLYSLGVEPGSRVGICLERSVEMVAGTLAVLEVGAAYVPLDVRYPRERLRLMLEDSAAVLVLTQKRWCKRFLGSGVETLCLDASEEASTPPGAGVAMPFRAARERGAFTGAGSAAYVMYTSGSTGRPKGIVIRQRSIVRLVCRTNYIHLNEHEVVLQVASISFDAATFEIWAALLNGARLAIAPPGALSHREMGRVLQRYRVTTMFLTTGLFHAMIEHGLGELETVNQLLVGGDVLSVPHTRRALEALPRCRLMNVYGPTENTTFTACHQIEAASLRSGSIPIGRPIAKTQVHILDERLRPVPPGVTGELFTGGIGVARGYLQPALTAERFLPNPSADQPGDRLYVTGDLVRYLSDGRIDFLGREDHQVKVRGFRIEQGEIETALLGHPAVSEAEVVAPRGPDGQRRLIAYLVSPSPIPRAELRDFLRESLPDYMVPSAFVTLEALPLTPNGKVDRKALAGQQVSFVEREVDLGRSMTPVEELVAGVFSDLLDLERVGPEGDFFELGGHSLLGTQVISRLLGLFSTELTLRDLFETPTVAGLAKKIEAAKRRQELQAGTIQPVAWSGRRRALSFSQRRLWFLDRLDPGSAAYNIFLGLRLSGALRIRVLKACLGEIERRHETLRSRFNEENGHPIQVIVPPGMLSLPQVDLAELRGADREAEISRRVKSETSRAFDLERDPPVRATLLRVGERQHVLLVTMHHIISDGWSMGVFVRELTTLYRSCSAGRKSPLAELTIQFADFAHWQASWLQGEVLDAQLTYWRTQLEGVKVLELPTDRGRPAFQSLRGKTRSLALPRLSPTALREFGQRRGATLFMTLHAAFVALLRRYSGQDDFALGTPIANRNRAEIESLIGFFVNTLVLRHRSRGDLTFGEFLDRVREACLEAYDHQDLPFEKLVEDLAPQRDLSRPPFFQVVFILQNAPRADLALPDLDIGWVHVDSGTTKFDFTLSLDETPSGIRALVEYNRDLFDDTTISRLLRHYQTIATAAVADPSRRLADLPFLQRSERHQLMEWNDAGRGARGARSLGELLAAAASNFPERTALYTRQTTLSYQALDRRADRLARGLSALGVGPEVVVAVALERSADLVAALLAVVKAGGLYVGIDPSYPAERQSIMLDDSRAQVLIARRGTTGGLTGFRGRILNPDSLVELGGERSNPVFCRAAPENLAYLIYTSGSTGRPKGVAIHHSAVAGLCRWTRASIPPETRAGVLASTSVCFDVSIFELMATLTCGDTVILAENALDLPALPAADRVTLISMIPSAMAELLSATVLPPSVRMLFLGGEPLPLGVVEAACRKSLSLQVYNGYGPSEDTTYSSWSRIIEGQKEPPSIGRPLAGKRAYALDENGRRVPPGVVGQLFLAGTGLARGYFHRPGLTAERFVPDAFIESPGSRLYRTGDQVCYRQDGDLKYLGRLDHQVKVRGFRIELGEIEAYLDRQPQVRAAVVEARQDLRGESSLVAYATARGEVDPEVWGSELRQALGEELPGYMVPQAVVVLDELPRTPNGKVNRQALPAPDLRGKPQGQAAADSLETELVRIWQEVLATRSVGVEDSFFDLGGHSLLGFRLISQIRDCLGVSLPLATLFQHPTVRSLASSLRERDDFMVETSPVQTIQRVSRDQELALSFSQRRLWFLDRLDPGSVAYNMFFGLRLTGSLRVQILEACLSEIEKRHEALRTRFIEEKGTPLQVIVPPGAFSLPQVDLSGLQPGARDAEVDRRLKSEAHHPFDLERDPPMRATLLRPSDRQHVLLITMHHIVSDGWSMGIFVRELTALYRGWCNGQEPPLARLPIQYADFAQWQVSWLHGEVLEEQLAYWRQQLEGVEIFELPTDRRRPAVQSLRGKTWSLFLPGLSTADFQELGQRCGATLFMTLHAAFAALLSRYTSQDDLAFGTPVANRSHAEVEDLIGFFVNTVVLRHHSRGDWTFREFLDRVRDVCVEAYEHQDLPFEKLVEELAPQRDLSRTPFFQVMFILQNAPTSALELPGLAVEWLQVDSGGTKFDLTLSLDESASGIRALVEYNRDLFDDTTICRLLQHYQTLGASAVGDSSQHLSNLPLLRRPERHQLTVEWNDTGRGARGARSLDELFAVAVLSYPERIALYTRQSTLSYQALDRRADRMAHGLTELGVGPEVVVAVALERSADLVTTLLAVVKAGGLYVGIDPSYPAERQSIMLDDSGAQILITRQKISDGLKRFVGRSLDPDSLARIGEGTTDPVRRRAMPANLAYLIYTSGSTGRPKGVAIHHAATADLCLWAGATFSPEEWKGVLASTSVCFDLSIFELMATLAWGGTVILADNVLELPALPAADRVTLINTVPSAMTELLAANSLPRSVRTVNLAGEPLPRGLVEAVYQESRVNRVYNLYGPSEDTTYSTWSRIAAGRSEPPSIGRPLTHTRAYVLDDHGRRVALGGVGQLFLAGTELARCYFRRPSLTAERFLPDSISGIPSGRLYRTGDQVRYRQEGNLKFLGRLDHQVKVRGFRIELGEIEAYLDRHPNIHAAVVEVREDARGERRLVAYVTSEGEREAAWSSELRGALGEELPGYMVPDVVVVLDELPRTPNGKVDRRALPAPELRGESRRIATDSLEISLLRIWQDVLATPSVGVEDSFFDLGGHSLLGFRLISRICERLGVSLPLTALFQHPTVRSLASRIRERGNFTDDTCLVQLRNGQGEPWFWVHGMGGNVHVFLSLSQHLETTLYAFQAPGSDGRSQPLDSIESLVALYLEELRAVKPSGPYRLGGWSMGGLIAFEMAVQLVADGEQVEPLVLVDSPVLSPDEPALSSAQLRKAFVRYWNLETEPSGENNETENLFRLFGAHYRARQRYVPSLYEGKALLFRASETKISPRDLGWSSYITGGIEVVTAPGNHFTVLDEPGAEELARQIRNRYHEE